GGSLLSRFSVPPNRVPYAHRAGQEEPAVRLSLSSRGNSRACLHARFRAKVVRPRTSCCPTPRRDRQPPPQIPTLSSRGSLPSCPHEALRAKVMDIRIFRASTKSRDLLCFFPSRRSAVLRWVLAFAFLCPAKPRSLRPQGGTRGTCSSAFAVIT